MVQTLVNTFSPYAYDFPVQAQAQENKPLSFLALAFA